MMPYIVTSFDTLDSLTREGALAQITLHDDAKELRVALTGEANGFLFLEAMCAKYGEEIETNAEAVASISDTAKSLGIAFDIMSGRIYKQESRHA